MVQRLMTLERGSLLNNRYRIVEILGQGGMGSIYRAIDENLSVDVAVKENLFTTEEYARQFRLEAVILANIRHPNLPRVTDHFVIAGQGQYLVMDFVPGEDCRRFMERGPVSEAEALRWAKEILEALAYLHSQQPPVIHRDVKPGNIKITPQGRAVLVDFGLAKAQEPTQTTTIGARAYTPGFAPPEQYGEGRTDVRTDVYSLGATLYALLTGLVPADGLERAMGAARLIPLGMLAPGLSPHVVEAVERAMSIRREDRFASAEAFAAALAAPPTVVAPAADHSKAESDATMPPARGTKSWWWRRARILPTVGVLVGVSLMAAYFALGGEKASPTPTQTVDNHLAILERLPSPGPISGEELSPSASSLPSAIPAPSPTVAPTPRGGGAGQIAFVSDRAGSPQVFVMAIDGSNPEQLTRIPDGACQPAWSPDGSRLLFVTPCKGKSESYPGASIYVLEMEDRSVAPLISKLGGAFDPDWSVGGIAFTHLAFNLPSVWRATASGSGVVAVSQANAQDRQPSWSPGDERLVVVNTS